MLNIPTSIRVDEDLVFGWSSTVSFSALSLEEENESYESHPVFARVEHLGGVVWLLSDSSVFINSMIDLGDNRRLLEVISYGDMLLDETHISKNMLTVLQNQLTWALSLFNILEIRYLFVLSFGFLLFSSRIGFDRESVDEVEVLLERYPDLDRDDLIELRDKIKDEQD